MSNVVSLDNRDLLKQPVNKQIIEMLEDILNKTKNGQVKAVAVIVVKSDRCIDTRAEHDDCRHELVAGTIYLQNQLVSTE